MWPIFKQKRTQNLYICMLINIWGRTMKMKKKYFLEAVIVTAIALAFIMPGTAGLTDTTISNGFPEGMIWQNIVDTKQESLMKQNTYTLSAGSNIWISPLIGDDYMPGITIDGSNNVVVMWTNEQSFTESYQAFTYSNNPSDETTWTDNVAAIGWSMENPVGWDIAYISGPHYNGLAGGAYDYAESAQVGFQFDDVTDWEGTLMAWTWSGEAPGYVSYEITDQITHNCNHYPDLFGFSDAWVYHFEGMGYDLPGCPVFFRTDPVGMSGLSYFDAQENEDTSPANAYDYFVKDSNTIHHVMSNVETSKIIWKMTIQDEEGDIEYTPYQDTIADGTFGQIAGNANIILITYIDGSTVKAIYSNDDGTTWQTSTIGSGKFANVCEVNGVFHCVFVDNKNLYLSSSEDGGATWSSARQVNDVDGTVVDEHKFFDVHKGGIVWTDSRNEDYDIYYQSLETGPSPFLVIESIGGGLGVSAVINNVGDAAATNVQWTISSDGTVFVGGSKSGSIASIPAGGTAQISSFLLGFGDIAIDVTATSDEGASAAKSANGKLLLFFVTGL
jgi:hypothetical protein